MRTIWARICSNRWYECMRCGACPRVGETWPRRSGKRTGRSFVLGPVPWPSQIVRILVLSTTWAELVKRRDGATAYICNLSGSPFSMFLGWLRRGRESSRELRHQLVSHHELWRLERLVDISVNFEDRALQVQSQRERCTKKYCAVSRTIQDSVWMCPTHLMDGSCTRTNCSKRTESARCLSL